MIQFNSLIIHNFGSYGHTELDLQNRGFCLVTGENKFKKDNAASNGSGKSFIWSAICFALTGETMNGLSKSLKNINIENDNTCYITLDFSVNKDHFIITRHIEPKSDLKIIKNSIDISGKGIRESEKKLTDLLPDINKDFIASTLILGQGLPNKFSSFSPSGRKELLEKLTKSDFMIEDIKHRVNARSQELTTQVRAIEDSLIANSVQLNLVQKELANAEDELKQKMEVDYSAEIAKTESQISVINTDLTAAVNELSKIEVELESINSSLLEKVNAKANVNTQELIAYNDKHNKLLLEQTNLSSQVSTLTREINRLKAIKDICPTCGQPLKNVVKPSTDKEESELTQLNESLAKIRTDLTACEALHTKYTQEINEQYDHDICILKQRLANLKQNADKLKNDSADFQHYLNIESEKLANLKVNRNNLEASVQSLKNTIAQLQVNENSLKNALQLSEEGKASLADHLAIIKKMETLIKRDFRGYLLSNIINYIDLKAKEYSEIVFGTRDLEVCLNGNNLDITYCTKLIEALSGGERQKVDLILQFAIRDMLNTYLNMTSNILVLDEITDFLDKQSCKAVMQLIENELNTVDSVFIVSHHAESLDLPIDSKIHIIKNEFGISEICS